MLISHINKVDWFTKKDAFIFQLFDELEHLCLNGRPVRVDIDRDSFHLPLETALEFPNSVV